ncbi:protein deadpan [Tribolium castaneum]|uniref:Protein deadpan-like Protein n=1 Tax=Tribolium castaneum TaxID=7070 RepID=D6X1J9_TRICA|nr:PREDICTED: protein deadpan [Tribolium castaneum]EFA09422.1 Protein deadpan-like Protein [Tribolium castaneum]|eukprot:XP_967694.1 PREDICTED: protein deadpan [Tribolium castaneum]
MPISEDEYEIRPSQESVTMSKAELRKTHKPIMEKRRRARINHCLNEIKTLILEAMNKDPARHSKLEKADILEMAVKHLQNVQRQQLAVAMASDPSVLRKFKSGFNECANEIDRFVSQSEVDDGLKDRMRSHLQKCINGIDHVAHFNFPNFPNLPFTSTSNVPSSSIGDQNNNARVQIPQSIQLIPSRLPSGEIALLLPNSSNLPFLQQRERPSAFVTVIPSSSSTSVSPPASPKGFRPVQPTTYHEQPQVPQVSSTSIPPAMEVKSMKFPIHQRIISPKKTIEPLCIITNQSERFKQAQTREDGADFEENRTQGVKRKYAEMTQGLLTVAEYPATKIIKTESATSTTEATASTSRESNPPGDGNSDMWRPW